MATARRRAPTAEVQLLHAVVTLDYDAVERLATTKVSEPNVLALEAIAYDDSAMLNLLFDLKLEVPSYYLLLATAWHGDNTFSTMLERFDIHRAISKEEEEMRPLALPVFADDHGLQVVVNLLWMRNRIDLIQRLSLGKEQLAQLLSRAVFARFLTTSYVSNFEMLAYLFDNYSDEPTPERFGRLGYQITQLYSCTFYYYARRWRTAYIARDNWTGLRVRWLAWLLTQPAVKDLPKIRPVEPVIRTAPAPFNYQGLPRELQGVIASYVPRIVTTARTLANVLPRTNVSNVVELYQAVLRNDLASVYVALQSKQLVLPDAILENLLLATAEVNNAEMTALFCSRYREELRRALVAKEQLRYWPTFVELSPVCFAAAARLLSIPDAIVTTVIYPGAQSSYDSLLLAIGVKDANGYIDRIWNSTLTVAKIHRLCSAEYFLWLDAIAALPESTEKSKYKQLALDIGSNIEGWRAAWVNNFGQQ